MGLSQSFVNLVREHNEDYIISLIEQNKVDIFARDDEERTALHWASAEGKKNIAAVLIDNGVPVNSVDKHKYTPLHTAVFRNQEESAKLLIQKGIDINLQDEAGMTALHWAVYEHNYSCMQLLLRKGARLDLKNEKGQTVWDIARGLKKAHRNRVLEALQASSSVNEHGPTMLSNWSSLTTKEIYLSSLCQLWGAIKFIHPYVAYRDDIDWDLALVETLPKILNNTNLSPQDFKVVIVDMLRKLKDPNTIVANLEPSVQKLVQTPKPSKRQITTDQTPTKSDNQTTDPLVSSADRSSPIIPRANKPARQVSQESLPTEDSASSTSEPTTTPATPEPSRKPTGQPYVAVMSNNTGVVVTTDYNQFNDPQRYNALLQSMYTALNNCSSVIFDVRCRSTEPLKSSSALSLSIMYYEAFKLFLTDDLFLPTYRHRTFHGYPEHRRGYSHMFHHGFMITDCEVLRPDATQRQQFISSLQTPATPVKTGASSTPGTPLATSGSNTNLLASTEAPSTPMTPDRRQVNIGTPKTQRNTPAATPNKSLFPVNAGPHLPTLNKSLVFIIDQETPQGIVDIALAFKSQYKAGIVYQAVPDDCYIDEVTSEMYLHEPGIAISVVNLPPSVKVFIRQNEKVNPDGTIGLRPDVVIKQEKRSYNDKEDANDAALAEALKLAIEKTTKDTTTSPTGAVAAIFPKRKLDEEYKTMLFPNVEYRYLALFKLWNIVHYFYPYKDLLEKPWDQVLVESMPRFEACTTPLEYALAITEVVNGLHDTHAYVRNSVLSTFTGTHVPPVKLRTIGNRTIVVQVEQLGLNDEPKEILQVGDLILEIEGETVATKRAKLENLISASSAIAKTWRVDTKLLSGALGSVAKLRVLREVTDESGAKSEQTLDVEVPRVIQAQQLQPLRQGPTFGLLDKVDDNGKQIGYIDLSRIQFNEVDPAMDALLHTNSLIIDLRGYIKGTIYKLAPRLVNRKVAVSRTITPILSSSLLVDDLQSGSVVNQQYCTPATFNINVQSGSNSDANSAHFQGKIVALIDTETISHGEHSCLWLKACRPDCYFIGKPTSGTVGNITNLVLPGGVAVGFTSMGVQDRDGSQVQRVGIKPDLFVEETLDSIKQNRDVILEAGIGHFQTKDPNQLVQQ